MTSDDTEHTLFVAQSLLVAEESSDVFVRRLSWSLRWWLCSMPAGIGLATLRSIVRLWLGWRPSRSGVRSAGNGAAMRSAPIGAYFASSADDLRVYVAASTRITHRDPRALTGALAVASIAAWSRRDELRARPDLDSLLGILRACGEDEEWLGLLGRIEESWGRDLSVEAFAKGLGLETGVSGYVYHTVPVAVYAWYRHFGDFAATLGAVLDCGGDTDTTGAIAGALAGVVTGERGIPREWLEGICDWPRGVGLLRKVADRLAASEPRGAAGSPVPYFWPAVLPRNALFLLLVLLHGLRRLAPPY